MLHPDIKKISKNDIDSLIENAIAENKTIEYKAILPGDTADDKKEFLADVTAFANASGGDLILGVSAKDGVPIACYGCEAFDTDNTILRLENLIRDGIKPRIGGIQFREVRGFEKGSALVIRIPRSWSGPHMVTLGNRSQFYLRNNAGKHPMDIDEIRGAFALSNGIVDRIQRFRRIRMAAIRAHRTPMHISSLPRIVLHVIPFISFSPGYSVDMRELVANSSLFLPFSGFGDYRVNVDGLLNYHHQRDGDRPGVDEYCQVYRSGVIESVSERITTDVRARVLPAKSIAERTVRIVNSSMQGLRSIGVSSPSIVAMSLVGCQDVGMFLGTEPCPRIDREELHLPEVLLEENGDTVEDSLRPAFDSLWNAGGCVECSLYDADGKYRS